MCRGVLRLSHEEKDSRQARRQENGAEEIRRQAGGEESGICAQDETEARDEHACRGRR